MSRLDYIVAGHAPEPELSAVEVAQAITTRYFAKKQNELKQIELLRRFANPFKKNIMREQTVLSFVQL